MGNLFNDVIIEFFGTKAIIKQYSHFIFFSLLITLPVYKYILMNKFSFHIYLNLSPTIYTIIPITSNFHWTLICLKPACTHPTINARTIRNRPNLIKICFSDILIIKNVFFAKNFGRKNPYFRFGIFPGIGG